MPVHTPAMPQRTTIQIFSMNRDHHVGAWTHLLACLPHGSAKNRSLSTPFHILAMSKSCQVSAQAHLYIITYILLLCPMVAKGIQSKPANVSASACIRCSMGMLVCTFAMSWNHYRADSAHLFSPFSCLMCSIATMSQPEVSQHQIQVSGTVLAQHLQSLGSISSTERATIFLFF